MDLDEVARLYARLNLDEDDGPASHMNQDVFASGRDQIDLCLLGKVLGNQIANLDGLRRVLRQIWHILNSFNVEKIGLNNIFLWEIRGSSTNTFG
ncbi:hypothetical protein TorRG33x02_049240 [Trema orientale]|uniref:Uncharacterized protein n=1 Tax=Trema orientale TaxID=63057 RepID=A0A2P5FNI6_TREOI|nr:hypothetical protein TorRG33x02_049240 [Trema orientale]